MFLEFCNYNTSFEKSKDEYIEEIFNAIELGFSGVCISLPILRDMREYLSGCELTIATEVDYPRGLSDKKVRMHETLLCLKSGANLIDIPVNPILIQNEEYSKISEEIVSLRRACSDYNSTLRIIIDHNKYELSKVVALNKLFEDCEIEYVLPSSGYHNDDIYDNLIACTAIEARTNVKCICNGYIWLKKHYDYVVKSGVFGLRIYSLKTFCNF